MLVNWECPTCGAKASVLKGSKSVRCGGPHPRDRSGNRTRSMVISGTQPEPRRSPRPRSASEPPQMSQEALEDEDPDEIIYEEF